jgi:class 3 adenylate cyclase
MRGRSGRCANRALSWLADCRRPSAITRYARRWSQNQATSGRPATQLSASFSGAPQIDYGLALHVGDVMYGNIGGDARLDFTVIGPAVNLTARIESMCKDLQRSPLLSAEFVRARGVRGELLGDFALKGVGARQPIYGVSAQPSTREARPALWARRRVGWTLQLLSACSRWMGAQFVSRSRSKMSPNEAGNGFCCIKIRR